MKARWCRANVFSVTADGEYVPAGQRWFRVRYNAAIPDTHKMFK